MNNYSCWIQNAKWVTCLWRLKAMWYNFKCSSNDGMEDISGEIENYKTVPDFLK